MLLALLLSAATPLSVADVVAHHEELADKAILMRGYLAVCGRMGCIITDGPRERLFDGPAVSLGAADKFDRVVIRRNAVGREVVVKVRVRRNCWEPDICLDRADQAQPLRLIDVLTPENMEK